MAFLKRTSFIMATAVLIFTAGCQFSSTAVATWRGRVILAANKSTAPEFVLYISKDDSLTEWKVLGSFAGHVGNMVTVDDDIWFSFGNGPPQRKTLSPDGRLVDEAFEKFELDFTGSPPYMQVAPDGSLWLVGFKDDHIKIATLSNNGNSKWQDAYPLGPKLPMSATKGKKLGNGEFEIIPPKLRTFTTLYADALYVFWSTSDSRKIPPRKIFGSVLRKDKTGEYVWTEIKGFEYVHYGLQGSIDKKGNPVLWLGQEPLVGLDKKSGPFRFVYDRTQKHWSAGEFVDASAGAYVLGYGAEVHPFTLSDKNHLLLLNKFRLYFQAEVDGRWVGVPEKRSKYDLFLRLFSEFADISFSMGFLVLIVLMLALLVRRFSGVPTKRSLAEIEERNPPVPIMQRIYAGAIDIMSIGGAINILMSGNSDIPADPMYQDIAIALRLVLIVIAITIINTITEVMYGVSIGKFAVGLRVETIDGKRPLPGAIIKRNLLRILDLMPFPMAALGIASIFFTRNRQRIGDRFARTVVVKARPYPRTEAEE